jgi:hypothetical protein
MAVRLRAVPSPPVEPTGAGTPRIRLPGYPPPAAESVPTSAVQQATYYSSIPATTANSVPSPASVVQTVQITPLAANVNQPSVLALGASDGFRPRGSMR